MSRLEIQGRAIGTSEPVFIVAEMSGNHKQSLDRALALVDAAAKAGAHALKLQTYTADTMTLDLADGEFFIDDPNSLWKGQSLYSLYQKAYTPWEWHEPIFKRARELGLVAFSTPFDETAVDFLETLDVPCYKVASFENTDLPLIRKIAATGKPIIMSTGMATITELDEAMVTARQTGCEQLVLLKCTSTYPATPENSNLLTIPHMRELFDCEVGLSDHTIGIGASVAAVVLGATMIEKHFALSHTDDAVDSVFSLDPQELATMVVEVQAARQALGKIKYGPTKAEERALKRRRSIYITKNLKAGEVLTKENLRCIRPGSGLPPKHFESLLGKTIRCDVKKGTPMRFDLLA
jgi:N-acetylneuraminate synthase